MKSIFVYITCPSKPIAKRITKHLLERRLIACANIFPIESFYWWQNKIEGAKEYVLICKTLEEKYAAIKKELAEAHPYSIPCIAKLSVGLNKEFASWLKRELK